MFETSKEIFFSWFGKSIGVKKYDNRLKLRNGQWIKCQILMDMLYFIFLVAKVIKCFAIASAKTANIFKIARMRKQMLTKR